ncbi:hypothetical protein SAMN05444483_104223 [Salegentibacter echinorum]|uniref:Uncharacterized protein n=1 Tax=Salegentibacter echinorum TaxID=1073325 RepID=A0A1M5GM70_SALEC|nr:hypothetical protein SAMN05444483_104223 [Salegentibacter echinorum]
MVKVRKLSFNLTRNVKNYFDICAANFKSNIEF